MINGKQVLIVLNQLYLWHDSPVISYHPKKNYLSIVLKYRNNPFYAQFAEIKFDTLNLKNGLNIY